MAQINFGGTIEEVVTREEFPMEKAHDRKSSQSSDTAYKDRLSRSISATMDLMSLLGNGKGPRAGTKLFSTDGCPVKHYLI